ncbi:DUF2273 domain-containing protein [Acidaminococcus sp. NSJ-142]|jgi:uncharacterized membrane protein|uniref:DUF2273 domain-containing protein n=1 Tax=Acidaminococcus TaxID=904 RepID=UPI000CF92F04|nr:MULTISPECIES: DUF2273 domain-containing protein [Acidaminococcus]MCD2435390.1 DUF2273 domain-containing protein [Acidaminococcus hominis]MCH4095779.1 DUF2273 domain-containing protein [Acidaminococcus provencensis]RHK01932.1 DUF2273 domain-containing protein [Acidaminococcus sp. AM05-11]
MWQEILKKLFETSRWRIICAFTGLVVGVLFILLGFFRAVFLLFCIGLGFYIGNKMDEGEDLVDLLDNLLPPYRK